LGQATRGKTALNRLRQVDTYIALAYEGLLRSAQPLAVDLGFGAQAWTTLEMYQRWATHNASLRVLGIEIEPTRVAEALPYAAPPKIDFKLGGFNIAAVLEGQQATIIRAYNVLRQYDAEAVWAALAQMGQALKVGGLLIEGTSNPSGRIVVFDLYRKTEAGLVHRGIVFGTNFRARTHPLSITEFQTILPKRLIHQMLAPVPSRFFSVWAACEARSRSLTRLPQRWPAAAYLLAGQCPDLAVDLRPRLLRRGFLHLNHSLCEEQALVVPT
jgi:hypothetical protein